MRSGPARRAGGATSTTRIPREDYERIRRTQLRYRILPVAFGLVISAIAVFFILTGNAFSVFFLLPVSLMAWFMLIRPVHRKRYRQAIADLPRWDLRAEGRIGFGQLVFGGEPKVMIAEEPTCPRALTT